MNKYEIYCDSLTEGLWFKNLSDYFNDIPVENIKCIKKRGQNIPVIESLVSYDRPDIILLYDNVPILVVEKTSEVPTGHNVGQRFARLIKSIEENILTIFYCPFDAMKHGQFASKCNLNVRLLDASLNASSIHNTPLLAVNWICDKDYELKTDGSENIEISKIINGFIKSGHNKFCPEISNHLCYMKNEYIRRVDIEPKYLTLPSSVVKLETKKFLAQINKADLKVLPENFKNRPYTYLYRIGMNPGSCKRQDPYTGMQFIYDYICCRNGTNVFDKKNNLVLYFPNININTWFLNNPNNPNTKSCNWYLTANAFLFKDAIYYNGI